MDCLTAGEERAGREGGPLSPIPCQAAALLMSLCSPHGQGGRPVAPALTGPVVRFSRLLSSSSRQWQLLMVAVSWAHHCPLLDTEHWTQSPCFLPYSPQ